MKKEVIISIKGIQHVAGESDTTELTTVGSLFKNQNGYSISYKESSATGYDGCTTVVSVKDRDTVQMNRYGSARSTMTIQKGVRHLSHYNTGFGEAMIGIFGSTVTSNLEDSGGDVYFRYTLDINTSLASENEVYINVRECN